MFLFFLSVCLVLCGAFMCRFRGDPCFAAGLPACRSINSARGLHCMIVDDATVFASESIRGLGLTCASPCVLGSRTSGGHVVLWRQYIYIYEVYFYCSKIRGVICRCARVRRVRACDQRAVHYLWSRGFAARGEGCRPATYTPQALAVWAKGSLSVEAGCGSF